MTDPLGAISTDELLLRYSQSPSPAVREALVERHYWIVDYVARRYQGRGEPTEDLAQVAALGLVSALNRYDPETGASFPGFAIPSALGEVRRHFRDRTWRVRVPRGVKDLVVQVNAVVDELTGDLGRPPTIDEIADRLGVNPSKISEARLASAANHPIAVDGGDRSAASSGVIDIREEVDRDALIAIDDRMMLNELIGDLPQRNQEILRLRFFAGLSQDEIAEHMGISQPHVSRLLRSTLSWMRERLSSDAART